MGDGLVTDDRSREEGRHYTDECGARLHGCGASIERSKDRSLRQLLHLKCISL
jgi:hypothetical protein